MVRILKEDYYFNEPSGQNIPLKFVYTVTDKGKFADDAIKSIRTLRKFIDKRNIIVFYTPPRSKRNFKKLSQVATVKKVPNLTEPFVFSRSRGPSRYGEKIHLCDVDCPNVVFLDADTVIKKNPIDLLHGNYDFSARPGGGNRFFNQNMWESMFRRIGKESIPMPNTGFMIFKNYCHKEIREEWLRLINSPLPNPHPQNYLKEQYALALAVSGRRIKWMTSHEHAFKRGNEDKNATYVFHGKKRKKLLPKIKYRIKRRLWTVKRSIFLLIEKVKT